MKVPTVSIHCQRLLRTIACIAAACLVLCLHPAHADESLVVMVTLQETENGYVDAAGAGVILHQEHQTSTIVTAAHTLDFRNGTHVFVEFFEEPGRKHRSEIIYTDQELDIAFLRVPTPDSVVEKFENKRRVLMPQEFQDEVVGGVYAIGNPGRRAWFGNRQPDSVISKSLSEPVISFQASTVIEGMSGGGLFSEHGTLLGMILDVGSSGGRAISILEILGIAKQHNIPNSLEVKPGAIASVAAFTLKSMNKDTRTTLTTDMTASMPDYSLLHLYWIANPPKEDLETSFASWARGTQKSNVQLLFENTLEGKPCSTKTKSSLLKSLFARASSQFERYSGGSCEDQLKIFLCGAIGAGVSPDLVIPAEGSFRRYSTREHREKQFRINWSEAMLATALRSGNEAATEALLECGATPHPYQQLHLQALSLDGTAFRGTPTFLDPISRTKSDKLKRLLEEKGALPLGGRIGLLSSGPRSVHFSYSNLDETEPAYRKQLERLCERKTAPDIVAWCLKFKERERKLIFTTLSNMQLSGLNGKNGDENKMFLIYPLFIGENYAFFYANFGENYEARTWDFRDGIALIPIKPEVKWYILIASEYIGDNCYSDELCWNYYNIKVTR